MDATLNLAFLMNKSPRGAYALLLGAGISRPAQIRVAWEIVQDILSQLDNEQRKNIPAEIGYDALMDMLGKTQTERNLILREYFEPTPEERARDKSIKSPTEAHRAIARLMQAGYIKVVVTTNFDRLLEIALSELNVPYDVVRSENDLAGLAPIRHLSALIIQLHGDYRDGRILNTPEELARGYGESMTLRLKEVFSEYGLIVCGWSAEWDPALIDLVKHSEARWFSTYWVEPGAISGNAGDIIQRRRAELIPQKADEFFVKLLDETGMIEKFSRVHPMTVDMMVERTKAILSEDRFEVKLETLIMDTLQQEKAQYQSLENFNIPDLDPAQNLKAIVSQNYYACESLINILVTLCWYGSEREIRFISSSIESFAATTEWNFNNKFRQKLAPLLLVYATTIAALKRDKWDYLNAILMVPRIRVQDAGVKTIFEMIRKFDAFASLLPQDDRYSDTEVATQTVIDIFWPAFKKYIPDEIEFRQWAHLTEMILALIAIRFEDEFIMHEIPRREYRFWLRKDDVVHVFWKQAAEKGETWEALKYFFNGGSDMLISDLTKYSKRYLPIASEGSLLDFVSFYKQHYRAV